MTAKRLIIPVAIFLVFGIVVAILGKWDWMIWGLLLLCPLIHLFGHNHSGHGHEHSENNNSKKNGTNSCH